MLTRFRQDFVCYIKEMFNNLVDITDPICYEIDPKKASYLISDTTGVEANVAENNPKFFNTKLNQAKNWLRIILKSTNISWSILFYQRFLKQIHSLSSNILMVISVTF